MERAHHGSPARRRAVSGVGREAYSSAHAPIEDRLWGRTRQTPNGCLEYLGSRCDGRYGSLFFNGRTQRAHRVAYQLTHGPIPAGQVVMHSCDNPPCVNPKHLSAGTLADNARDRSAKGRNAKPTNWAGWQRRLTHCKRGHEFTPENTRVRPSGNRACRACTRQLEADRRARQRPQVADLVAVLDPPTHSTGSDH